MPGVCKTFRRTLPGGRHPCPGSSWRTRRTRPFSRAGHAPSTTCFFSGRTSFFPGGLHPWPVSLDVPRRHRQRRRWTHAGALFSLRRRPCMFRYIRLDQACLSQLFQEDSLQGADHPVVVGVVGVASRRNHAAPIFVAPGMRPARQVSATQRADFMGKSEVTRTYIVWLLSDGVCGAPCFGVSQLTRPRVFSSYPQPLWHEGATLHLGGGSSEQVVPGCQVE